jgi:replicative DNA helicase
VNAVHELGPRPVPPSPLTNVETEAALLGALMQHNDGIDRIADLLTPDDFSEPAHGRIFEAIVRECAIGHAATPITLRSYFTDDPALKDLGGAAYLASLTGSFGSVGFIDDFARQVLDLARRRRLIEQLQDVIGRTHALDQPVADLIGEVDSAMTAALRVKNAERTVSIATAFDETLKAIEDEAAGLGPQGIRIAGLEDFNSLSGDLRRGELCYIGGRPSMGKTALSIRIALGAALNGHGTLFESLEMKTPELTTRAMADLIFDYGESPGFEAVRKGKLDRFSRERLQQARQIVSTIPLELSDPSGLNVGRLAMKIRRTKRRMVAAGKSLDLVIVDYLGLIKGEDRRAKRFEEVGEISRTLKQLAKECDVAMVVLAQLNRECERREDKRPQLSDLRDAGDVEQDADQVLFVYRDEYYLERSQPDEHDKKRGEWEIAMGHARDRMELIAAKVRNGRVGKRNLYFFAKHQAVRDHTYMRDLP